MLPTLRGSRRGAAMMTFAAWLLCFGWLRSAVGVSDASVLRMSFPPWTGHPYTTRPEGGVKTDWRAGALSFGPDPATSVQALLTGVEMVHVGADQGKKVDQGPHMLFNFTVPSREQLLHKARVLTQRLGPERDGGFPGRLCRECNTTDMIRSLHNVRQRLSFLDSGWRVVEQTPPLIQVYAKVGSESRDTGTKKTTTALPVQVPHWPRKRTALNQLQYPKGIAFHEGGLFIADTGNHRVLRHRPSEEHAELVFGGKGPGSDLDQLQYPKGIAFHEGSLFIADTVNNRVLRHRPSEEHAELVFGGKGPGSDLDQLQSPRGIAFHEGSLFIADTGNHRVLRHRPSEEHAELVFGGKGPGSDLDQLQSPMGIAFHEGSLFIADTVNNRALRHRPSEEHAELVFGGKGRGSDLDQLQYPRGIAFHEGSLYISDLENNRYLVIPANSTFDVSFTVDLLCDSAHVHDDGSLGAQSLSIVLRGAGCMLPAPTREPQNTERPRTVTLPGLQRSVRAKVTVQPLELPDTKLLRFRKLCFSSGLAALALACAAVHGWGSWIVHASFAALVAAAVAAGWNRDVVYVPSAAGQPWTGLLAPVAGMMLPWATVPAYVLQSAVLDEIGKDVPLVSCSTGICWELHVFTALCAVMSISLWVMAGNASSVAATSATQGADRGSPLLDVHAEAPEVAGGGAGAELDIDTDSPETAGIQADSEQPPTPEEKLPGWFAGLEVPKQREFLIPEIIRKRITCEGWEKTCAMPKPLVVYRLDLLVKWLWGSVFDQYGDCNSYIITKACGFSWAPVALWILVAAFALQHVGGAIMVAVAEEHTSKWQRIWKTVACLLMAPPMELLGLQQAGLYMSVVRTVFEDVPQLVYQAAFTWMIRWDLFIVANICFTAAMLSYTMYAVIGRLRSCAIAGARQG